jgi:hypothetical protein
MPGDRTVQLNLLLYLVIAVAPTLLFWVALRAAPVVVGAVRAITSSRRGRRPPWPGSSLEDLVADLRRLRRRVVTESQPNRVRRVALQAAYDETLLAVCDLVDVDAPLRDAVGRERPFARLQTEAALEDAGIVIDSPRGGAAAA